MAPTSLHSAGTGPFCPPSRGIFGSLVLSQAGSRQAAGYRADAIHGTIQPEGLRMVLLVVGLGAWAALPLRTGLFGGDCTVLLSL